MGGESTAATNYNGGDEASYKLMLDDWATYTSSSVLSTTDLGNEQYEVTLRTGTIEVAPNKKCFASVSANVGHEVNHSEFTFTLLSHKLWAIDGYAPIVDPKPEPIPEPIPTPNEFPIKPDPKNRKTIAGRLLVAGLADSYLDFSDDGVGKTTYCADYTTQGLGGAVQALCETDLTFINFGIGGQQTHEIRARVQDVVNYDCEYVILSGGINNLIKSQQIGSFSDDMDFMCKTLTDAGKTIVLYQTPYFNLGYTKEIDFMNNGMVELAKKYEKVYLAEAPEGDWIKDLTINDNLHPSFDGSMGYARNILKVLNDLVVSTFNPVNLSNDITPFHHAGTGNNTGDIPNNCVMLQGKTHSVFNKELGGYDMRLEPGQESVLYCKRVKNETGAPMTVQGEFELIVRDLTGDWMNGTNGDWIHYILEAGGKYTRSHITNAIKMKDGEQRLRLRTGTITVEAGQEVNPHFNWVVGTNSGKGVGAPHDHLSFTILGHKVFDVNTKEQEVDVKFPENNGRVLFQMPLHDSVQ